VTSLGTWTLLFLRPWMEVLDDLKEEYAGITPVLAVISEYY
jgi:hypothetical protein